MKNKKTELKRALTIHILGNAVWFIIYFQFVITSETLEEAAVNYYINGQGFKLALLYYISDNGLFAYLIPSTLHLWKISKSKTYSILSDATRAIIILIWTAIILLQPLLIMSYNFGPRSW